MYYIQQYVVHYLDASCSHKQAHSNFRRRHLPSPCAFLAELDGLPSDLRLAGMPTSADGVMHLHLDAAYEMGRVLDGHLISYSQTRLDRNNAVKPAQRTERTETTTIILIRFC